ncbi:hypothetical protein [Bacillus sp. FJAT-49736]|uniref:hypothetical protein n=1 Tax=Bacillus sp. FJAT-49736 TaxID=2833582 RepID=UPI001BC97913|nr:hypothetical protein [Bacillus sp. FJAT-49736]MBS4172098.1 hypothetical protein [Bacillus sp. FJAT-49736]
MNLNQMVMDSLAKMDTEGKVQEIVEKHVSSTIESIVKDVFGSWSDFSKNLKDQVQDQLQINFKELDLASYNTLIMKAINEKLNDTIATEGLARINGQIDELLSDTKDEYKLSELVKELVSEIDDLDDLGYEDYHEMSMHIRTPYGLTYIHLDAENGKDEYECKYKICIDPRKNNEIVSIDIQEDRYGRTKELKSFDVRAIMRGFRGLEETLFKLYARKGRIILDEDQVELEISNPEYD